MNNYIAPIIFTPTVFQDERGYFFESFNSKTAAKVGIDADFVQDNESMSSRGTLRGLHFQAPPHAQAKLVRVVRGCAIDVAVDIRKGSPFYGKVYSCFLSEANHTQFFIPKGFAHGFLALADNTVFQYKCDEYYDKDSEGGIAWDSINFDWQEWLCGDPIGFIISEKDRNRVALKDFDSPFIYENSEIDDIDDDDDDVENFDDEGVGSGWDTTFLYNDNDISD